jgi:hypothetical protein
MSHQYFLKCDTCGFRRWSDGSQESFADIREVVLCAKCHGAKTFKCPGCGFVIKAKRYVELPDPTTHRFLQD